MKATILVCDDDKDIVEALAILLSHEGYNVLKAYDGEMAIKIVKEQESIHLLILDMMMPKKDGLSTLLELRQKHKFPVLVLSAKSEDADKVLGLNFGADDYLTKPYNPLELLARVKSQIRRYTDFGSLETGEGILQTGDLILNREEKWLKLADSEIALTATEFSIVELLMSHLGRVFSIEEIYQAVWREEAIAANNTVAVHIRRIREKIEIDTKNPRYLKVVWGIGYKIEQYD